MTQRVLDLGSMPPANALLESPADSSPEYPLLLEACECGNFQLRDCLDASDLYRHYYYTTPESPTLQAHYGNLVAKLQDRGLLAKSSRVLEIGSNIGIFLEFLRPFVAETLGVDPAQNVVEIANARGIDTIAEFFDAGVADSIAEERGRYDLVFARHCMAHNRDPLAMLQGVQRVLSDEGVFVLENAYALNTILGGEFDQVYHEHMFFFTLHSIVNILSHSGLSVIGAFLSDIHGGSIVCLAKRSGDADVDVAKLLEDEQRKLTSAAIREFAHRAQSTRDDLRSAVGDLLASGRTIFSYGATAKSATLMNYCGLSSTQIPFCADSTLMKQGRFFPKSHIEVVSEEFAFANPPDAFLLTAWNYRDELIRKARSAGVRSSFIVPIPRLEIVS
jgi:SAM-dependent methyltransferase